MTISMTGFAARKGQGAGHSWAWDVRSDNGKGLALRLRLPDWVDGLELALRSELAKALGRGNVNPMFQKNLGMRWFITACL